MANFRAIWTFSLLFLALNPLARPQCPQVALEDPGDLPLTDLLVEYRSDNKYGKGLQRVTICDAEAWQRKRPSVERRALYILGNPPSISGKLSPRVENETTQEGYHLKKIRFQSGSGDEVTGYLLIPVGQPPEGGFPAVLAMHSTIKEGAAVTAGIARVRDNRYYGMELALRGYVVLAVDLITAGERIYPQAEPFETWPFDRQFPNWSAMGKILHDHRRALDYLTGLPQVNSERIGAIGHSSGGYNAFFLQAFDPRVKAAVSSCGFTTLAGTTSPFAFARNQWFVHFPRLRDYLRAGIVPVDLHEIMALCAPRPLFNYSAKKDKIFPSWESIDRGLDQVAELYRVIGAPDSFKRVDGEGEHDFPPEVRKQAYRWLDGWLK